MLLPSPLVGDAGWRMSGPAEWHMHRTIVRAVEDGRPCVAIAVGFSERAVNEVVSEELASWKSECTRLGAKNEAPIVIRVSHKSGGVHIDVNGAREAGFEFEPSKVREVQDVAWTEIGIEHYEATAWLALTGILEAPTPPPWYMVARGRPLRSLVRLSDLALMIVCLVVAVVIGLSKPGAFRDRPWFDGTAPPSSGAPTFGGSSNPPSYKNNASWADDDE